MGSRSGQGTRLAAVNDDARNRPAPETLETRRYDPMAEERWLRDQFRRERASAYWFAASKWGGLGLIVGICIGAFMMYTASISTLPIATDAMARAAAINAARDAAEGRIASQPQPLQNDPAP